MNEICSLPLAIAAVPVQQADIRNLHKTDVALEKGTIFPDLYLPFFITETELSTDHPNSICRLKEKNDECKYMIEIMETGFYLDDLTLYLDTHPEDKEALELYESYAQKLASLKQKCKKPTLAWAEGPAPWEGVCI